MTLCHILIKTEGLSKYITQFNPFNKAKINATIKYYLKFLHRVLAAHLDITNGISDQCSNPI